MRIAIVNDRVIAIEAMRRVLLTVPDYQVAWVAQNGVEAVTKCLQDTPDLILMDLLMPVMDGVETTRQIMQKAPCAILVVTADVKQNAAKVFEAMSYGALDAVNTPILGTRDTPAATQTLLRKIGTIDKLIRKPSTSAVAPTLGTSRNPAETLQQSVSTAIPRSSVALSPTLIAIGASTGGPKALATLLSPLPAQFPAALVIVQHVDAQFAEGLIDWLDHQTALKVKKATIGDSPQPGVVLVACTDDHLSLQANRTLTYVREPIQYPYRPSIDVFFKSLARYWRTQGTAILLTGMGRDGAEGLSLLRQKGWYTIAQDKASSVVYGMPRAAIELDAAMKVGNPSQIADYLLHSVSLKK